MDYRVSKRFVYLPAIAFFLAVLPLAAQTPASSPAFAAAERALLEAEREQAAQWASESYQMARDAYAQAQALQLKRKKTDAERAALTAEAQAALATAQARQRRLAEQVERKVSENNALRRDLLLGKDGTPP
jgi:ABC-type transporter lipoprotein component MlaA